MVIASQALISGVQRDQAGGAAGLLPACRLLHTSVKTRAKSTFLRQLGPVRVFIVLAVGFFRSSSTGGGLRHCGDDWTCSITTVLTFFVIPLWLEIPAVPCPGATGFSSWWITFWASNLFKLFEGAGSAGHWRGGVPADGDLEEGPATC